MSKLLTANALTEKNKKYDVEPINLLEIDFGGAVGTKYYSDRPVTVRDANGDIVASFEPLVADWGQLDAITDGISTTKDITIMLINATSSPISDLFSVVVPEGKSARLWQWFEADNMIDPDAILLFNGKISSPVRYNMSTVQIDIVDKILDIEEKIGTPIDLTTYPRALSSHVGRILPHVFGSVEGVPAVGIEVTGKSIIRTTLNDEATTLTIEVEEGSVFPTTAFTLVVEDEEIAVDNKSGNTLTASARGINATSAAFHLKGVQCYEKLGVGNKFRYQVHNGVAKSISNVRINGFLLSAADYTIDQVNYPGQIVFTQYPSVPEEKETLWDDYDVDTLYTPGATDTVGANSGNVIDDDKNNFAALQVGQKVGVQRVAPLNNTGQYKRTFITVKYFTNIAWDASVKARLYYDDNLVGDLKQPTFDPNPEVVETAAAVNIQTVAPETPSDPVSVSSPAENSAEATISNILQQKEGIEEIFATSADFVPNDNADKAVFRFTSDGGDVFFEGSDWRITNALGGVETSFYYQYAAIVYEGFTPDPLEGGDWVVTDCYLKYDNFLSKGSVSIGNPTSGVSGFSETAGIYVNGSKFLTSSKISANNFNIDKAVLGVVPAQRSDDNIMLGFGFHFIFSLEGYIKNARVSVRYERVANIPDTPGTDPVTEDPTTPVVVVPSNPSHTVEQQFDITSLVSSMADLLSKDIVVYFEESSSDIDGIQLYVKEVLITIETGSYGFEYSDLITADVEGYYVDGTEITTDYGVLDELITRPDQVTALILTYLGSFSLSDLNVTKYNIESVFYIANGYRVDFALTEEDTVRNLIETLNFQVRTDQYWEDGLHVIKVLQPNIAAIKSLDTTNVEDIEFERGQVEEVINDMEVRYEFNYASVEEFTINKYKGIVTLENSGSQANYGVRRDVNGMFFLDKVRDDITANSVSNYYLAYFSSVKKLLKAVTFLDQIELEKHDIVNLTWPLDSLVDSPHRVIAKNIIPGNKNNIDRVELFLLREDYTYHTVLLPADAVTMGGNDPSGFSVGDVIGTPLLTRVLNLPFAALEALKNGVGMAMDTLTYKKIMGLSNSVHLSMDDSIVVSISRKVFITDSSISGFGVTPFGGYFGYKIPVALIDEITVTRVSGAAVSVSLDEGDADSLGISDDITLTLVEPYKVVEDDNIYLAFRLTEQITVNIV